MKQQLVRVALAAPRVHIAAPEKNVDEMLRLLRGCLDAQVLLPELAVTGYTCGDLFHQTALIDAAWRDTLRLAQGAAELGFAGLVAVGVPVRAGGRLFNCAAYLYGGEPVALVPKTCLPNYAEFYEKRWFARPVPGGPIRFAARAAGQTAGGALWRGSAAGGPGGRGGDRNRCVRGPVGAGAPQQLRLPCGREPDFEPLGQQRNGDQGGIPPPAGERPGGQVLLRLCLCLGGPPRAPPTWCFRGTA